MAEISRSISVPCEAKVTYLKGKKPDGTSTVSVIFDCNTCPFQQIKTFEGSPSRAKTIAIDYTENLRTDRQPACATTIRRKPGRPS